MIIGKKKHIRIKHITKTIKTYYYINDLIMYSQSENILLCVFKYIKYII